MNALDHSSSGSISNLLATLTAFAEAGIDPAFDSECEELERRLAEYRLTIDHN